MKHKRTVLKNGLRLITVPMKDNATVTAMIMVEAGSRYETSEINGISHFLEHMCFKGTNKRSCSGLAFELDKIGASYNAFTGDEYTGYYAKSHYKHLSKILDVLSDIYINSNIPEEELEKERGVILEEINMYEDLPQRKVHHVYEELVYGDHPLGRTIAGPKKNIKSLQRKDFLDYRDKHYFADATTVVIAGNIDEKEAKKLVEKSFAGMKSSKIIKPEKLIENQKKPAVKLEHKRTDQSHMILGFRTFNNRHKDKVVLGVLSAVLSGGMSSRLFSKMRDELGICYYVRSGNSFSYDHGHFMVRSGVGNGRLEEAVENILKILSRLKTEKVDKTELDKVKNLMTGRLAMSMETSDDNAEFYADQELYHLGIKDPQQIVKEIKAVTPEQIQRVAKKIFVKNNLNLAVIGPNKDEKKLQKLLKI